MYFIKTSRVQIIGISNIYDNFILIYLFIFLFFILIKVFHVNILFWLFVNVLCKLIMLESWDWTYVVVSFLFLYLNIDRNSF